MINRRVSRKNAKRELEDPNRPYPPPRPTDIRQQTPTPKKQKTTETTEPTDTSSDEIIAATINTPTDPPKIRKRKTKPTPNLKQRPSKSPKNNNTTNSTPKSSTKKPDTGTATTTTANKPQLTITQQLAELAKDDDLEEIIPAGQNGTQTILPSTSQQSIQIMHNTQEPNIDITSDSD